MKNDYEYDVAFSFLAADEGVALRIGDQLQDRLKVFVYSQQQKNLAGRDGEEAFAEVFGQKTRVVVILYRAEWGSTTWTRIEETAIRDRAHDHGYDFTLWVPLESVSSMPPWLPKNRLWFNFERFGDTGLVAVIDQLVQECGGNTRPETLQERASRMQREVALSNARRELVEGYDPQNGQMVMASAKAIIDLVAAWAEKESPFQIEVKRSGTNSVLLIARCGASAPTCVTAIWNQPYTNHVTSEARLKVVLLKGVPHWPGHYIIDEPIPVTQIEFRPDLNVAHELCWRRSGRDAELTVEAVADQTARFLMDGVTRLAQD